MSEGRKEGVEVEVEVTIKDGEDVWMMDATDTTDTTDVLYK